MLERLYEYRNDMGLAGQKCESLAGSDAPDGATPQDEVSRKAGDVGENLGQSIDAVQVCAGHKIR